MNHKDLLGLLRSSHWRCSVKKVFLEIPQILQENTCVGGFFYNAIGLQACNFIKKDTSTLIFFYEIYEIFKNMYFEEHLRKTASICLTSKYFNK